MNQHRTDVHSRIQELLVDLLNVDPADVRPNARLREDLKVDELDLIEFVMALEEEYGFSIPDEDVSASSAPTKGGKWRLAASVSGSLPEGEWKLKTVADVERYISRRLQET